MSEWITDRRPKYDDADSGIVYAMDNGKVKRKHILSVKEGTPWVAIRRPEPYVKPKKFTVKRIMDIYPDVDNESAGYCIYCEMGGVFANNILTREAAERIAAIYEEAHQ